MRGPTSVLPRAQHTRFIRRGERQLMATSGEAFRRLAIRWPAMRELRRAAHTVYSLQYHFVFTTKYRKPVLVGEIGHSVRDLILAFRRGYFTWVRLHCIDANIEFPCTSRE